MKPPPPPNLDAVGDMRCGPSSGKHPNIRTSHPVAPALSVRMFGSWGKKRANASSNCAAL